MWPTQRATPPPANQGAAFGQDGGKLLRDAVSAFARVVLRGLDLLPTLAPEDADKTTHSVRLPARRRHDLRHRRAFGALDQHDDLGLLVAAPSFGLAGRFLSGRQLLGSFGRPGCGRSLRPRCFRCGRFLRLDWFGVHQFLLDRAAVVTIHHSGREKLQGKSLGGIEIGGSNLFFISPTHSNFVYRRY